MMGAAMGDQEPARFEGKHENGVGTWLKSETHEFFTVGKNTVTRPIAEWKKIESEDGEDPMAMQKNMMKMFSGSRTVAVPAADLTDLGKKLAKVKKSEKKETLGETECSVYEGELTDEAAEELVKDAMPMGRFMKQAGEVTHTGKMKAWVDSEGRIVKYEVKGTMSASLQGMELEMSSTKAVTLSGIDSTKVELPAEAKKALEK
jgi:hypothetical protein